MENRNMILIIRLYKKRQMYVMIVINYLLRGGDIVVIFDTTNNFDNQIKGVLYMSMMDVDYLVQKYQISFLKSRIPLDYIKAFEDELEQRKNEYRLSVQYYSILTLGIETTEDEELLKIIKNEVEQGNLFTRSHLQSISREDLKNLIKSLGNRFPQLSNEELYQLRSYMMSEYIFGEIELANIYVQQLYENTARRGTLDDYKNIISNLESIGASSEIIESDYFNSTRVKLI
ncbi:MAG TPA: hypothetical protein IAB56_01980 [Candidatus Scybalousia intestinigallinarum]|nr:hypothetical protein [Candidatus Scybalousia intestinigallinarum]